MLLPKEALLWMAKESSEMSVGVPSGLPTFANSQLGPRLTPNFQSYAIADKAAESRLPPLYMRHVFDAEFHLSIPDR